VRNIALFASFKTKKKAAPEGCEREAFTRDGDSSGNVWFFKRDALQLKTCLIDVRFMELLRLCHLLLSFQLCVFE